MDSVQQIYVTNQSPLSQTFRASFQKLLQLLCPGFYRWKGKQIVLHVLWLLRIHFFPRCVNNIMHCRCVLSVIHFITSYSCKIQFSSQSKRIQKWNVQDKAQCVLWLAEMHVGAICLHTVTTRYHFPTGRSPSSLIEHCTQLSY